MYIRKWLCAVMAVGVLVSAAAGDRKDNRKDSSPDDAYLYGERVDKAIKKAQDYLLSKQEKDGSWGPYKAWGHKYPVGPTAMVTYALLESGISPQDDRMERALYWLVEHDTSMTYEIAFRASALRSAMKGTKGKYRKYLRSDMYRLVRGSIDGAYAYESPPERDRLRKRRKKNKPAWDHSNSQYGLLGVWAAYRANEEVPRQYWQKVMNHWLRTQKKGGKEDGGWGYRPDLNWKASPAMTAAGLASLFVCYDNLYTNRFLRCNASTEFRPIERGLEYFQKNFKKVDGSKFYYHVYGVERVGLACGYKYFGTTDWYKWGLEELLDKRENDGHWKSKGNHSGNDLTATAYALLFLIRGRNGVLFNKLEFDGDWNNRPRDAASVTRWLSDRTEKTVAWQIVNLRVPVREWHDAPILYLSGAREPKFSDEDIAKLRRFVLEGGTILSVTECDGKGFAEGMRKAYARMFPRYELTPMGPEHIIYSIYRELKGSPKMYQITNGVRPYVIHTDEDLPRDWQLQRTASRGKSFEAAANIYMYVTDLGQLRNRGVSHWPREPKSYPGRKIKLARLKHSGNYDPEPLAFERLRWILGKNDVADLGITEPMAITDLPGSGAQVASLSGVGTFKLSDDEVAALKKFVAAGGTLFVNSVGGHEAFADSAKKALRSAWPDFPPLRILPSSDLYDLGGHKISGVNYRPYRRGSSRRSRTDNKPRLKGIVFEGRLGVIYSEEDIVEGLLGIPAFETDGYTPESAVQLMRNIVLYAGRQKTK